MHMGSHYTASPETFSADVEAIPADAAVWYEGFMIEPVLLATGNTGYAYRMDGDDERLGIASGRRSAAECIEEIIGDLYSVGAAARPRIEVLG